MPMKHLFLFCMLSFYASANTYDTSHCQDPLELEKWAKILSNNPKDDAIQALHAMWVGLCVKVDAKHLTTNDAQRIFERARESVVETQRAKEEALKQSEGERL